jgi:hypothetical protein
MSATTPIPASEYDSSLLNALLAEEIEAFVPELSEYSLSKQQELRGGLISWFCYFVPELVNPETAKLLRDTHETNRTTYFERWYQLLPLEMALFGLTREESWLNNHKKNLAYGGSLVRYYVMQSLALAVPELYFDDPYISDPIRHGLSIPYFGAEEGAAMLAMCKGATSSKKAVLREWHDSFRLNRPDILSDLAEGKQVENWFFLSHFFTVQTYVIHRLCGRKPSAPSGARPSFFFVGSLMEQVEKHPMMQPFLRLPENESPGGAV